MSDLERAGLEAALEAAGILYAWVTPNGQLLDFDTNDVMLLARTPFDPRTSLAGVLEPAIDRDQPLAALVHTETVRAILAGIGVQADESDMWVDSSGRWRLGVLQGQWTKSAAAFIGRGARDAARHRRLNELAGEIVRAENAVQAVQIELDRIERRQRMLSDELARSPGAESLREAHRAAQEAQRQLAAIDALVIRHETLVGELAGQANAALSARAQTLAARSAWPVNWLRNGAG